MKKLVQGIIDFRQKYRKDYKKSFGGLAKGQSPDTLLIACSDSRVVPNTFASTDPGDLFVLRNVGNLVPCCDRHGISTGDESEVAALEFSILNLNISDIIVCGHSECGAMAALLGDRSQLKLPHLKNWLRHGDEAIERLKAGTVLDSELTQVNQLSQLNVLLQMENIKSYSVVKERMAAGSLAVHGWWFDITHADVYTFEDELNRFVIIDDQQAKKLFARFEKKDLL